MIKKRITFSLIIAMIVLVAVAGARDDRSIVEKYRPSNTDVANINRYNRVHNKGNIWMNMTNWGFFGNNGSGDNAAMEWQIFPGVWAPQCEYPGNSDVQYIFMGAIWVGALVQEGGFEFPRVTCGSEGWTGPGRNSYEFQPGEIGDGSPEDYTMVERSTIH